MKKKKTIECETCEGLGEVVCSGYCSDCSATCENQVECPDCEGTGEVEE